MRPRIVSIVGPTASGKTALGIALAKRFGGEIVSADSRQVYRGMDIGTAKPTVAEQRAVPHHLIDIRNPDEDYTVAEFKRDAIAAIDGIFSRGKLPIIVGGTGLYVRAVVQNLDIPKVKADLKLRETLEKEAAEKGLAAVFKKLVALDPEAAYVVDPKNPRRVVRALEVTLTTGAPFTAQRRRSEPLYDALTIGLAVPGTVLRKRINLRADKMMRSGLVTEVRRLVRRYGPHCRALDAIGYREIAARLPEIAERGGGGGATRKIALNEISSLIKTNTWHYAKRQMTWFKKESDVHWIRTPREAAALAARFISRPAENQAGG